MSVHKFHEIFAREVAAISERRQRHKRPPIELEQEDQKPNGTPVLRPAPGSNLTGLALSGGGIRSSAFCLGAMQALDEHGLIEKVDYLSTVSGGGFIGALGYQIFYPLLGQIGINVFAVLLLPIGVLMFFDVKFPFNCTHTLN